MTNWSFEMGSPNGLMRNGWTRNTLKIGDVVTVEGSLARDGSPYGNARAVVLTSTGKRLFAASSQTEPMSSARRVALASAIDRSRPSTRRAAQGPAARRPVEPTPRLADGTPNLGRVPGEKGVWNVPYIQNMGMRIPGPDGKTAAERGTAAEDGGRGGAKAEPDVPFLPWARGGLRLQLGNNSKYDPEGYCLPPGGPRMMATPYPMEIIQLPEQKRIFMIFEGATHIWREIYMDGRPHPQGDALNPTYLGHSVGRWEGDTLVVDVVGFNENTLAGLLRPPAHRPAARDREVHAARTRARCTTRRTIDDPGAYTKPWTVRVEHSVERRAAS